MKKVLLIVILLFSTTLTFGQQKQINELLDRYEKMESVESVLISPDLLQMATTDKMDAHTKNLISKLSAIRVLSIDKNRALFVDKLGEELKNVIERAKLPRILRVKESDETLEMYLSKAADGFLLFVIESKDEMSIVFISGEVDQSIVSAVISGDINIL